MSSSLHTAAERAMRQLAADICAAIRAAPDVLEGKVVVVPELNGAVFAPPGLAHDLPRAHRHVADLDTTSLPKPMRKLIRQFRALDAQFIWGHAPGYSEEKVGRAFLDNYCHALLSGPDGPLRCPSPLGAFVLFGPGTLYRDHHHRPNEVYLALTGGGQWRVGDRTWRALDAGQSIFIASNAVHAIRAGDRPLLTFSFWLEPGDLETIAI